MIRGDLHIGKCHEPSFNMLSQCGWTASSTRNRVWSRSHLMSHAAVVNNLVDYGQVATIPDFGEESFYYVSGMHYRAAIGLARKEISHGRVLRQTQR